MEGLARTLDGQPEFLTMLLYVHLVSSADARDTRTYSLRFAKRKSSSSENRKYALPVK